MDTSIDRDQVVNNKKRITDTARVRVILIDFEGWM